MRGAFLALGMLGACSFAPGSAAVGGDDQPVPDAGGGSNHGTVDTDGDGVVDDVDNCPMVANADQRDHDADGRGDACDVCPHLADDGADQDGDGVGDACDPHPDAAGDRIAFFEGFYEDAPGWGIAIGGETWHFDGATARQVSTDLDHQLQRGDVTVSDAVVEIRMKVNAMAMDEGVRRSAGISVGFKASDDFYFCGLAAASEESELDAGKVYSDFFGTTQFDSLAAPFGAQMPGDFNVVSAHVRHAGAETTVDCAAARGATTASQSYSIDDHADGTVGVRTNGVAASFDYVFVVTVPAGT